MLVEDGELDGDAGQFVEMKRRGARSIFAVFEIEVAEGVAVDAIDGQQNHDGEVRQEDGGVESVPVVEVLEGRVGVLHGLEVVAEAVVGRKGKQGGEAQR